MKEKEPFWPYQLSNFESLVSISHKFNYIIYFNLKIIYFVVCCVSLIICLAMSTMCSTIVHNALNTQYLIYQWRMPVQTMIISLILLFLCIRRRLSCFEFGNEKQNIPIFRHISRAFGWDISVCRIRSNFSFYYLASPPTSHPAIQPGIHKILTYILLLFDWHVCLMFRDMPTLLLEVGGARSGLNIYSQFNQMVNFKLCTQRKVKNFNCG